MKLRHYESLTSAVIIKYHVTADQKCYDEFEAGISVEKSSVGVG